MKRARIILADNQALLLGAFKSLLEPEFEVVGFFLNGRTLVAGAKELQPDVIILEVSMPLMNGLIAGEQLKKILPTVKLIYLTIDANADLATEAFRLGASGYLLKSSGAPELSRAINETLLGRSYLTPLVTKRMIGSLVQNRKSSRSNSELTQRQQEVLQLLVEGCSMKEVASILKVSPRTVAFHKYSMMEKLNIKSSSKLIEYAIKNSIAGH